MGKLSSFVVLKGLGSGRGLLAIRLVAGTTLRDMLIKHMPQGGWGRTNWRRALPL